MQTFLVLQFQFRRLKEKGISFMTDDLVTRLREHNCDGISCCELPDLAADEIIRLVRELRIANQKADRWRRVATQAFEMLGGHVEGCRRACMCTCGYEHLQPLLAEEEREKKDEK
jgi:hypothetical protein